MTSKERRRQYNKIWARVSRAQKKADNKETISSVEMASIAESDSLNHNQQIEEDHLDMFSNPALSSSESEQDITPTLREELSEWACIFQVKHFWYTMSIPCCTLQKMPKTLAALTAAVLSTSRAIFIK